MQASARVRRGEALSRRLLDVDRDLRARVEQEADVALALALTRAGNRIASRAQRDAAASAVAASTARPLLAAALGPAVLAALGLTADELLADAFADLTVRFELLTEQAQALVLADLAETLRLPPAVVEAFAERQAAGRGAAAVALTAGLSALARQRLSSPEPEEPAAIGSGALTLLVRTALTVAGGGSTGAAEQAQTADVEARGGIGIGGDVAELLTLTGAQQREYEWVYGISSDRYGPHVALTGARFTSLTDERLRNPDRFPAEAYYAPGDHKGCRCDVMPVWALADEPRAGVGPDPRPGSSERATDGALEDRNEAELARRILSGGRSYPTPEQEQAAREAVARGRARNAARQEGTA